VGRLESAILRRNPRSSHPSTSAASNEFEIQGAARNEE
jgi:hypothetical protein